MANGLNYGSDRPDIYQPGGIDFPPLKPRREREKPSIERFPHGVINTRQEGQSAKRGLDNVPGALVELYYNAYGKQQGWQSPEQFANWLQTDGSVDLVEHMADYVHENMFSDIGRDQFDEMSDMREWEAGVPNVISNNLRLVGESFPNMAAGLMKLGETFSQEVGDAELGEKFNEWAQNLESVDLGAVTRVRWEDFMQDDWWNLLRHDWSDVPPLIFEGASQGGAEMVTSMMGLGGAMTAVKAAKRGEKLAKFYGPMLGVGAAGWLGLTGNMAKERALNDGREVASVEDVLVSGPFSLLYLALNAFGGASMFGLVKPLQGGTVKDVLKATGERAVAEGSTEAAQEVVQAIGETVGTREGTPTLREFAEIGAKAGFLGAGFGGIVGGGVAGYQSARGKYPAPSDDEVASVVREAFEENTDADKQAVRQAVQEIDVRRLKDFVFNFDPTAKDALDKRLGMIRGLSEVVAAKAGIKQDENTLMAASAALDGVINLGNKLEVGEGKPVGEEETPEPTPQGEPDEQIDEELAEVPPAAPTSGEERPEQQTQPPPPKIEWPEDEPGPAPLTPEEEAAIAGPPPPTPETDPVASIMLAVQEGQGNRQKLAPADLTQDALVMVDLPGEVMPFLARVEESGDLRQLHDIRSDSKKGTEFEGTPDLTVDVKYNLDTDPRLYSVNPELDFTADEKSFIQDLSKRVKRYMMNPDSTVAQNQLIEATKNPLYKQISPRISKEIDGEVDKIMDARAAAEQQPESPQEQYQKNVKEVVGLFKKNPENEKVINAVKGLAGAKEYETADLTTQVSLDEAMAQIEEAEAKAAGEQQPEQEAEPAGGAPTTGEGETAAPPQEAEPEEPPAEEPPAEEPPAAPTTGEGETEGRPRTRRPKGEDYERAGEFVPGARSRFAEIGQNKPKTDREVAKMIKSLTPTAAFTMPPNADEVTKGAILHFLRGQYQERPMSFKEYLAVNDIQDFYDSYGKVKRYGESGIPALPTNPLMWGEGSDLHAAALTYLEMWDSFSETFGNVTNLRSFWPAFVESGLGTPAGLVREHTPESRENSNAPDNIFSWDGAAAMAVLRSVDWRQRGVEMAVRNGDDMLDFQVAMRQGAGLGARLVISKDVFPDYTDADGERRVPSARSEATWHRDTDERYLVIYEGDGRQYREIADRNQQRYRGLFSGSFNRRKNSFFLDAVEKRYGFDDQRMQDFLTPPENLRRRNRFNWNSPDLRSEDLPDYRPLDENGEVRDVTTDDLYQTFGFRSVDFGKWVSKTMRQRVANLLFNALMDLREVLGIEASQIGLGKQVSLKVGAEGGHGSPYTAAHFELDSGIINLTKTKGDGSLAHEFGHALDYFLRYRGLDGDLRRKVMERQKLSVEELEKERPQVRKGYRMMELLNDTLKYTYDPGVFVTDVESYLRGDDQNASVSATRRFIEGGRWKAFTRYGNEETMRESRALTYSPVAKETRFFEDAQRLDKLRSYNPGGGKGYWSRDSELVARSFETWVADRIGARTAVLVDSNRIADENADPGEEPAGRRRKKHTYPQGEERQRFNRIYDILYSGQGTESGRPGLIFDETTGEPLISDEAIALLEGLHPEHEIRMLIEEIGDLDEAYLRVIHGGPLVPSRPELSGIQQQQPPTQDVPVERPPPERPAEPPQPTATPEAPGETPAPPPAAKTSKQVFKELLTQPLAEMTEAQRKEVFKALAKEAMRKLGRPLQPHEKARVEKEFKDMVAKSRERLSEGQGQAMERDVRFMPAENVPSIREILDKPDVRGGHWRRIHGLGWAVIYENPFQGELSEEQKKLKELGLIRVEAVRRSGQKKVVVVEHNKAILNPFQQEDQRGMYGGAAIDRNPEREVALRRIRDALYGDAAAPTPEAEPPAEEETATAEQGDFGDLWGEIEAETPVAGTQEAETPGQDLGDLLSELQDEAGREDSVKVSAIAHENVNREIASMIEADLKDRYDLTQNAGGQVRNQLPKSLVPNPDWRSRYLMPHGLAPFTLKAQEDLEVKVGDIPSFVAENLGMSQEQVMQVLFPDQVMAVAMAINRHKERGAFILGDDKGVGKGRVVASMALYAMKEDIQPIFVTQNPKLFSDIARDFRAIGAERVLGRQIRAFTTFSKNDVKLDPDASIDIFVRTGTEANRQYLREKTAEVREHGKLRDFDLVMTTYSQIQPINQQKTERTRFLDALVPQGMLLLDESHEAGGSTASLGAEENVALYLRDMLINQEAQVRGGTSRGGVMFASGTFAKNPAVLSLYFRTALGQGIGSELIEDAERLSDLFQRGGQALQSWVSEQLALNGDYIRRAMDMSNIKYDYGQTEINKDDYEAVARALQDVRHYDADIFSIMRRRLEEKWRPVMVERYGAFGADAAVIENTPFIQVMQNLIAQSLLTMKIEGTVDAAKAARDRGEKPVIALANTLEAFLTYTQQHLREIQEAGDTTSEDARLSRFISENAGNLTLADVFVMYLDRVKKYRVRPGVRAANGVILPLRAPGMRIEPERDTMTDEELGSTYRNNNRTNADGTPAPSALDILNIGRDRVRETALRSYPASPIDWLEFRLRQEGMRVGEITGRVLKITYTGEGQGTFDSRGAAVRSAKGKTKTVDDFNSGETDVVILNRAGSTGLSLHASEQFRDRSKRHMLLAQQELDTNIMSQMTGRVHRVDQVVEPSYTILAADIPGDIRPQQIAVRKLRSLAAQVSASEDTSVDDIMDVDLLTSVGNEAARDVLIANPAMNSRMLSPYNPAAEEEGEVGTDGLMRKTLGRIPMLPLAQQERFFELVTQQVKDLMVEAQLRGENIDQTLVHYDLEAAVTKESIMLNLDRTPQDGLSPAARTGFNVGVNLIEMDANILVHPVRPRVLLANLIRTLRGKTELEGVNAEYPSNQDIIDDTEAARDKIADIGIQHRDRLRDDALGVNSLPISDLRNYFTRPSRLDVFDVLDPKMASRLTSWKEDAKEGTWAAYLIDQYLEYRARLPEAKLKRENESEYDERRSKVDEDWRARLNTLGQGLERWQRLMETVKIGGAYRVTATGGDVMIGVLSDITHTGTTQNPLALSSWHASYYLASPISNRARFAFSRLRTNEDLAGTPGVLIEPTSRYQHIDETRHSAIDAFNLVAQTGREQRMAMTGNLIRAIELTQGRGEIASITMQDGSQDVVLLLPRGYEVQNAQEILPVYFTGGRDMMRFITAVGAANAKAKNRSRSVEVIPSQRGRERVRTYEVKVKVRTRRLPLTIRESMQSALAGLKSFSELPPGHTQKITYTETRYGVEMIFKGRQMNFRTGDLRPALERFFRIARVEPDNHRPVLREIHQEMNPREDARYSVEQAQRVAAATAARDPEIVQQILDDVRNMLPAGVELGLIEKKYLKSYGSSGLAAGMTLRNRLGDRPFTSVIEIALDGKDPLQTINHETIHALRGLDLFTDEEWASVSEAAKRGGWIDKHRVRERWKGYGLDTEQMLEEAIADEFAAWMKNTRANKQIRGTLKAVFERIRQFFIRIARVLRGHGYTFGADHVFRNINSGVIGSRAFAAERRLKRTRAYVRENQIIYEGRSDEVRLRMPKLEPGEFDITSKITGIHGQEIFRRVPGIKALVEADDLKSWAQAYARGVNYVEDKLNPKDPDYSEKTAAFYDTIERTGPYMGIYVMDPFGDLFNTITHGGDFFIGLSKKARKKLGKGKEDEIETEALIGILSEDSYVKVRVQRQDEYVLDIKKVQQDVIAYNDKVDPNWRETEYDVRFLPADDHHKPLEFKDKETEKRYREAAKGVPFGRLGFQIRESLTRRKNRLLRHYEHLPETPENADVIQKLLKMEGGGAATIEQVSLIFEQIMDGLPEADADALNRYFLLQDLYWTAERGMDIPFGFKGVDDVQAEIDKVETFLKQRPDLMTRVERRNEALKDIRQEMIKAGVYRPEELQNINYYRHQVLEYFMLKHQATPDSASGKVRSPRNFKRRGSEKDINANYLQVESEWMFKAFEDIRVAKLLNYLRTSKYNKMQEFKTAAKRRNQVNLGTMMKNEILAAVEADMPFIREMGSVFDDDFYGVLDEAHTADEVLRALKTAFKEIQGLEDNEIKSLRALVMSKAPITRELMEHKRKMAITFSILRERVRALGDDQKAAVPASLRVGMRMLNDGYGQIRVNDGTDQSKMFEFIGWLAEHPKEFPDASQSAQILFAVMGKKEAWVKEKLGDEYIRFRSSKDLLKTFDPEGKLVAWQPDAYDGKTRVYHMFTAKSISQHIYEGVLDKVAPLLEEFNDIPAVHVNTLIKNLKDSLVQGGPKEELLLPKELAATLNKLNDRDIGGQVDAVVVRVTTFIKQLLLFLPHNWPRYVGNNFSGDIDAILGDKMARMIRRKLRRAGRMMWDHYHHRKMPPAILKEALELGILHSSQLLQEIPNPENYRIDAQGNFILKETGKSLMRSFARAPKKYLKVVHKLTAWRENTFRLAAYLAFREEIVEKGTPLMDVGYGASNPAYLRGISSPVDMAARMARDVMGDYLNLGHTGGYLANRLIVFYRWMESNLRRYISRTANIYRYGRDVAREHGGMAGVTAGAMASTGLLVRMVLYYSLVQAWNNIFFAEEEEKLGTEERFRMHIHIGEWNGKIHTVRFQGALSDALGWIGMEDVGATTSEMIKGRASIGDVAKAMAKAPVNRLANGLNPIFKVPIELLHSGAWFPDVFRPRQIQDPWTHIPRSVSMGWAGEQVKKHVFGKSAPSRPIDEKLGGFLIYARDPGELAYSHIRGLGYEYLQRERGLTAGVRLDERSKALRNLRTAQRYGDKTSERLARQEMAALGVTGRSLRQATRRAAPLGMLARKDKAALTATLSPKERDLLKKARMWYRETYGGIGANAGQ